MHRKDIIVNIIQKYNYQSYLELGLLDPSYVFNHVPLQIKHSVDINIKSATFNMSTDKFFHDLKAGLLNLPTDHRWDAIFIDANHLANFVKRDLLNAIACLSDHGTIFLHDTLPPDYNSQLEDRMCQTAWKIIPYALKHLPQIHVCSLSEDGGGLGIVRKNQGNDRNVLSHSYNEFYEYYLMNSNRHISQNFIEHSELHAWLEKPFYNFEKLNCESNFDIFNDPSKVQFIWK